LFTSNFEPPNIGNMTLVVEVDRGSMKMPSNPCISG
jgi:hypothetical protein